MKINRRDVIKGAIALPIVMAVGTVEAIAGDGLKKCGHLGNKGPYADLLEDMPRFDYLKITQSDWPPMIGHMHTRTLLKMEVGTIYKKDPMVPLHARMVFDAEDLGDDKYEWMKKECKKQIGYVPSKLIIHDATLPPTPAYSFTYDPDTGIGVAHIEDQ